MRLRFTDDGWDDYTYWATHDRKMLLRLNKLITDTRRHPFSGIGKPEPLKHGAAGAWARRITEEHRLVYQVDDDGDLVIAQARFHYS
ncbi:MAG: Txe/YoeB family addiction module toxin [Bifidobacteriaceae bacterium]|nr:Txe/YoeB family addiction module toxin [Bifidobacteriaceae bacterium]